MMIEDVQKRLNVFFTFRLKKDAGSEKGKIKPIMRWQILNYENAGVSKDIRY